MKVDSGVPGSDLTVPAALDDPESFRKVSYRPIPKNPAPAAAKEKKGKKRTALQKAEPEKGTAAVPHSPENFRRGPGLWRAFTRLPQEEQRTLLKLQRSNPEEFRRIMQHKVDQLYEQDRIHRQELDKLAEAYRKSNNEQEKNELLGKLRRKIAEEFRQRLQDTRRDIESNKRRTAHLEAELLKREKNCDAIIDALLQRKLADSPEKAALPVKKAEKR